MTRRQFFTTAATALASVSVLAILPSYHTLSFSDRLRIIDEQCFCAGVIHYRSKHTAMNQLRSLNTVGAVFLLSYYKDSWIKDLSDEEFIHWVGRQFRWVTSGIKSALGTKDYHFMCGLNKVKRLSVVDSHGMSIAAFQAMLDLT